MKRFLWFTLIFMWSCSQTKIGNLELTQNVWILSTDDYLHPGQKKTMSLRFNANGYAYEEHTILKYPWQYFELADLLEINGQEFKILKTSGDIIYLENSKTGIQSTLERQAE